MIRPIVTYACPIWVNIPNHKMEELRLFERHCLRTCLNLRKTIESNYKKNYRNFILLNTANIHRIDTHIIKLCRNYFSMSPKSPEHPLLTELLQKLHANRQYIVKAMNTGYTPPEIFPCLDRNGFISSANNIPILHHVQRNHNSKSIKFIPSPNHLLNSLKYCTQIALKDKNINPKNIKKYWWLQNPSERNIPHITPADLNTPSDTNQQNNTGL